MNLNIPSNAGVTTFPYGITTCQDNGVGGTLTNNVATFGIVPSVAYVNLTTQTSGTYNGKLYGALTLPTTATVRNMRFYILGAGINSNESFNDVFYDGSTNYVAASSSGKGLFYSTDGINWVASNITTGSFNKVVFADSLWVALGASNQGIYTSTDAHTWTVSGQSTGNFNRAAYGLVTAAHTWVFTSASNLGCYYSTDAGTTVTQCTGLTTGNYDKVAFTATRFVVTSAGNTGLWSSADGVTFTQSAVNTGAFTALIFANSLWVAGSGSNVGIYTSSNGTTWTQRKTTGSFSQITYGSNFMAASSNSLGLFYSTAGTSWVATNITTGSYTSVTSNADTYVAVGAANTGIIYSTNHTTFAQSSVTTGSFNKVYYAGSKYLAAASDGGGILESANAVTWVAGIFPALGAGNLEVSCITAGSTIPTNGNVLAGYALTISGNGTLQDVTMSSVENYNLINNVPFKSTLYVNSDSAFSLNASSTLRFEVEYYFLNDPA